MNKIAKLIKAKTISFIEEFIKNYHLMNLTEVDAMIICKLYYLSETNNFLSIRALQEKMTLSEEELSNHIFELVNKGLIELTIVPGQTDEFSIDGVIEKLGELLLSEGTEEKNPDEEKLAFIIQYVERVFGRVSTQNDLFIINNWVRTGVDTRTIQEAVTEAMKQGKNHLKYADAIISSKKKPVKTTTVVNEELKGLLNNAYKKR